MQNHRPSSCRGSMAKQIADFYFGQICKSGLYIAQIRTESYSSCVTEQPRIKQFPVYIIIPQ